MSLVDLIFPKKCVSCGKFGDFLCSDCFSKIRFNDSFTCPACFKRVSDGMVHGGCRRKDGIDGVIPIVVNNGVVKKAVKKFKNERLFTLADTLGPLVTESLAQNESFYNFICEKPIIIPISIDANTLRKQGFNPSELLTDYVAQYFRLKKTKGSLTYSEKDLFKTNSAKIAKNVILVDLETNFSTLNSAAKILKAAGAIKVIGITLVAR